jgi:hypothetical protein
MENLNDSCCFCNKQIIENNIDPLYINVRHHIDVIIKSNCEQTLFAHFNCLRDRLNQWSRNYLYKFSDESKNELDHFTTNTQYLIQEIMHLKNINHWNVIYYGLKNNYINEQFVMQYCYALIEHNKSKDQFVLDIAALPNEERILKLLETKVNHDEIMKDEQNIYYKLWIYFSFGSELSNVIEYKKKI